MPSSDKPARKVYGAAVRKYAGAVRVFLTDEQFAYVQDVATREDRPASQVARKLIAEAITRRFRKAKAGDH